MTKEGLRLDSLQLIRALAMTLVLFIHTDYFFTQIFQTKFLNGLFFPGGDGGVDMFFVLSGFIIYFVHNSDINDKSQLLPYYMKRFIRIFPVYWLITFIILGLHFLFPQFGSGKETSVDTIFRSFLLLPSTSPQIIHAAWTLVYEVLFYISFGFLIWFGFKRCRYFIYFLVAASIVGWIYSIFNNQIFQESILYIFFSYHNFEFLLGCFGAYLVLRRELKIAKQLLIAGLVIFATMVFFEYQSGEAIYQGRLFGYGVSSFLVITSLSSLEIYKRVTLSKNILWNFLLLLGNASFSIYLTHQVLISGIARVLVGKLSFISIEIITYLTLITTIIFGILFYIFIEKPLLKFSRKKLL